MKKKTIGQTHSKLLTRVAAGIASAGFAATASAVGVGIGVNANAGVQAPVPVVAQTGGSADAHMSTSGSANTNAQWQGEANKGTGRASERMSEKGAESKHAPSDTQPEVAAATSGKAKQTGKR